MSDVDISYITMKYIQQNSFNIKDQEYIIISNCLYTIKIVNNFFVSFVDEIFGFFNMGKWETLHFVFGNKKIVLIKIKNNVIKNYFKLSKIDNDVKDYFSYVQKKWINKCELLLNLLNVSTDDKILLTIENNKIEFKLNLFKVKHAPNYDKHIFDSFEHYG